MNLNTKSLLGGVSIGTLGGLMGLGGAEFRLPLIKALFSIKTLDAIIINISISFFTVLFSLIFRLIFEDFSYLFLYAGIAINLLLGTLTGSFLGVNIASKIDTKRLEWLVFILLVGLGFTILFHSDIGSLKDLQLEPITTVAISFLAGVGIGIVSSLLGVAGGELLIPAIMIIYGLDIKLAGTLSLCISLPTLMVGMYRYKKKNLLTSNIAYKNIIIYMSIGSIVGAFIGVMLLGVVDSDFLEPLLALILFISAYKTFIKQR